MKNDEKICSVCLKNIDREDAPILTMGHFGNPRLLCDECDRLVETIVRSRDTDAAEAAMARLGKTISDNSIDDIAVIEATEEIFKSASERISKIKDGSYDFTLDGEEDSEDELLEIPEELLETEEDKKKTEAEAEYNRKFNKVMDIVTASVFVAAGIAFAIALIIFFKK